MIDDAFLLLCLDKCEWLEDVERENSSIASFLSCVLNVGNLKRDLIIWLC